LSLTNFENNLLMARVFQWDQTGRGCFGNGATKRVGKLAKWLGAGKVDVITDEVLEKVGVVEKVLVPLKKEGLTVAVYNGAGQEPTMESMREAVEFVRKNPCDVLIGVGGGACMDTAKIAAVMQNNPGDPEKYLGLEEDVLKKGIPTILVPTTAGTGSEFSNFAVVIKKEYGDMSLKTWWWGKALFVDVALIDPCLTLTCPPKQTAGSGMDALSHVIEALMSRLSMPFSDALALEAVKLISENLRRAYHRGEDLEARWALSLAASIGGMVIAHPWIGGPAIMGHMTAEALGPNYNIPHGLACGVCLPYAMKYNLPGCADKLSMVASAMGEDVSGLSTREAAFKSIEAVINLMKDIDMPTSLKEIPESTFKKEDIPEFAKYLVEVRQYEYGMPATNPRKLTLKNVTEFLENLYEGQI